MNLYFKVKQQNYQIMKIIDAIKVACKKAGIDEKHADRIQKLFKIEKEEGIDDFVILFKDNVLPGIADAEKIAADAAKESARKAAIEEYETTHKIKDGKPVDDPNKKLPDTMDPAIKALIEAQNKNIETLTGMVSGIVKTQTNSQKLDIVKGKMKDKIDSKFLDRIAGKVNLDAEDLDKEIEAQIKEFNDFKQELINESVGGNYRPGQQQGPVDRSVEDWAKFMNEESTSGNGVVDLGLK